MTYLVNYNSYSNASFNYPLPNFLSFKMGLQDVNKWLINSTQIIYNATNKNDKNCNDSRLNVSNYSYCQQLAFDFGQVYTSYIPNNWLCNYNGNVNVKPSLNGILNVSCNCTTGYSGKYCTFKNQDYVYLVNFLQATQNYLLFTLPNKSIYADNSTYQALLDLTDKITDLSFYLPDGLLNSILIQVLNEQISNNITYLNSSGRQLKNILLNLNPFTGGNPFNLLSTIGNSTSVSNDYFGVTTLNNSNIDADSTISFKSSSLRFLGSSAGNNPTYASGLPSVVISKNIKKSLPPSSIFEVAYISNPLNFISASTPNIVSTIVLLGLVDLVKLSSYPSETPLVVNIPWSKEALYVKTGTYQLSCKVNKFENSNWVDAKSCSILPETNKYYAVVQCYDFATIAVSCINVKAPISNDILIYSPGEPIFVPPKAASSFLKISSIIFAILGLLLI